MMVLGELKAGTIWPCLVCSLIMGEDWHILDRVIDAPVIQATLTWNGFAWQFEGPKTLLVNQSQVSHKVLAVSEVMWITCRWPSLYAISHLRIRYSCRGCSTEWPPVVSSSLWRSWFLLLCDREKCPEICETGKQGDSVADLRLLVWHLVSDRFLWLPPNLSTNLMNSWPWKQQTAVSSGKLCSFWGRKDGK